MFAGLTDAFVKRFVRLRFRYDMFLSYPRADAMAYAAQLREDLRKLDYECFLDQDEAPAGASLSATLRRAIDRSAVLVIVGSRAASRSPYVAQEIARFAASGRDVLPINIGSVKDAEWGPLRAVDQIWIDETEAALAGGQPSLGVIDAIEKRFRYTRRNVRVRTQIGVAGAAFVLGALLAVYLVQREVRNADIARRQAVAQQEAAETATARAEGERTAAEQSRTEALRQQEQAERNRAMAERASAEAERRRMEAEAAATEAKRQQTIAESRSLAAQADRALIVDPDEALVAALRSFRTAKTEESRLAIAAAFPRVLAVLTPYTREVTGASFSRDGALVLTTSADGTAQVWDAEDGQPNVTLDGRTSKITDATFSSDARRIVTGGDTAGVWDAETGKALAVLSGAGGKHASFSPDDRWILALGDVKASVWNAATGESIATFEVAGEVAWSAQFSPTGDRIVTCGDSAVRVWTPTTGRLIRELTFEEGYDRPLAFTPDGQYLLVGDGSQTQVWTADGASLRLTLRGHTQKVRHIAVSHDGRRIVTASDDRTVRMWAAETGEPLATLRGHTGSVTDVGFSADDKWIVSASADGTARVWNAVAGDLLATMQGHVGQVTHVEFSGQGRIVTVSSEPVARVWITAAGERLVTIRSDNERLATATLSPDGRWIATGTTTGTIAVSSAIDGSSLFSVRPDKGYVSEVGFSRDGERLVTNSGELRVWNRADGRLLSVLRPSIDPVLRGVVGAQQPVFSSDGRLIVAHTSDGSAHVWNVANGQELTTILDSRPISYMIVSPDGTRVLTAGDDKAAKVWSTTAGQLLFTLEGHTHPVNVAAFSPDGRRIVTGASDDRTTRVWNALTGRLIRTIEADSGGHLAFSDDGTTFVTGKGAPLFWDAATGDPRLEMHPRGRDLYPAWFSPDGNLIVTGVYRPGDTNAETQAQIRAAATHRVIAVLENRAGREHTAAFAPDGERILVASDNAARIYRILTLPEIAALLKR
jgi:WD40 repeat protein